MERKGRLLVEPAAAEPAADAQDRRGRSTVFLLGNEAGGPVPVPVPVLVHADIRERGEASSSGFPNSLSKTPGYLKSQKKKSTFAFGSRKHDILVELIFFNGPLVGTTGERVVTVCVFPPKISNSFFSSSVLEGFKTSFRILGGNPLSLSSNDFCAFLRNFCRIG
jgi:hypothetical protein